MLTMISRILLLWPTPNTQKMIFIAKSYLYPIIQDGYRRHFELYQKLTIWNQDSKN